MNMPPLSTLAKLRALLMREAPQQADVIRDALRQTAQTGREHSVIGLANEGGPSVVTRGTYDAVTPNRFDVKHARQAPGQPAIVDFHTHPGGTGGAFSVNPSRPDLEFYTTEWGPTAGRDVRTLIATPANRQSGLRQSAYNFFATDDPAKVLDPTLFRSARSELQFAARPKGSLRGLLDDPVMRTYLEGDDDIGILLEEAAPLLMMRHQAGKGLGRHELELGRKQLAPDPDVTDVELFRRLEGPSLEFLKSKGFQKGGVVKGALAKMREILEQPMFHGGNYKRGEEIIQPLYLTPNREMAGTYADPMRVPGATMQELRPEISRAAPERLVRAAARRYVPENEQMGYTPASAFDENLHDPDNIRALIAELERRNYDSAVATDIGMTQGQTAPAVVVFPGRRAFAQGGLATNKECSCHG